MKQLLLLTILFFCSFTKGNTLISECLRVVDGNTIFIVDKGEKVKVRLYGIDVPENGQPYWNEATSFVHNLCQGREVRVEVKGIDECKRVLGVVYVDSINVNEELLRRGLAWKCKYTKNPYYLKLHEEAKMKKLGLWSLDNPIDPWLWRKDDTRSRPCTMQESEIYWCTATPHTYHTTRSCTELTRSKTEIRVSIYKFMGWKLMIPCYRCVEK